MMVDNRYATALVIGSVLSLLATVYLSVAVGTPYWYQYSSPQNNSGEMPSHDVDSEKTFMEKLYQSSGTLGLWWYCIQGPGSTGECPPAYPYHMSHVLTPHSRVMICELRLATHSEHSLS